MPGFSASFDADLQRRLAALGVRAGDVAERFVRGAGPGGQKINKDSSTVWLRHAPSGIEVRCQRERSQAANRAWVWAELCARLEERDRAAAAAARGEAERVRRRGRQKSRTQKARMVENKRRRTRIKGWRGRTREE